MDSPQHDRSAPRRQERWLSTPRVAHLVDADCARLNSLAAVLAEAGWRLSNTPPPDGMASAQSTPIGTTAARQTAGPLPDDCRLLLHADTAPVTHAERNDAAQRGLQVYSYSEAVARLMMERVGVAVTGVHGKSTTAALAGAVLTEAGLDPTLVVGARCNDQRPSARLGRGQHLLAEVCARHADAGSLLPRLTVVTALGTHGSRPADRLAYRHFITRLPADGLLIVSAHCRGSLELACHAPCRVVTYGWRDDADWRAERLQLVGGYSEFELVFGDMAVAQLALPLPGWHNLSNALAAAALAWHAGADPVAILRGLSSFGGLARHLEAVGWWHGMMWWDDCAADPARLAATLATLRQIAPQRPIWCVFQISRGSHAPPLLDELAAVLQNADRLAVVDPQAGNQRPGGANAGATAAGLARAVVLRGGNVLPLHDLTSIAAHLRSNAQPGDICLTVGADDLRKHWNGFIHRFRTLRAAG